MTTKRKGQPAVIPSFAILDEEAEFWDTHSVADYWDDAPGVRADRTRRLSRGLTIRLDAQTLSALRAAARVKGLGPTTLARSWLMEHLTQPATANSRDS